MYDALRSYSPENKTYLVLGPCAHGGYTTSKGNHLGNIDFKSNSSDTYRNQMELPFFNYYLKDKGKLTLPRVQAFITGKNVWYSSDSWPPPQARPRNLYLSENGRLSYEPTTTAFGADSYRSDPAKPVPYSAQVGIHEGDDFMVEDQRFVSTRKDVLTYHTLPLDADLTIAGAIEASLHISSTGTDAEFYRH
ncbi:MAG: CocE/NonD family hydrolase [Chitinophagaceae bacterium]